MKSTISLAAMRTWQTGLLQAAVHRNTRRTADAFLSQYDLTTMQWLILGALYESGDTGVRVTDLAERADTTPSYITTSLKKLEASGKVVQLKNTGDSRVRRMAIPASYRPTCELIEAGMREVFRKELYTKVTRQQLEQYITVLQLLAVDAEPEIDAT